MKTIVLVERHGNNDLFNFLRCTSIGKLCLKTADCASSASEFLPTLNKLTELLLCGAYTGRCDLKLPASLKHVSLVECECSSQWLCSLLIALSSLGHPAVCHLWDFVLQLCVEARGGDNHIHLSDLRSDIESRDLSNIGISVHNGSLELIEILRDTSIGFLDLCRADCASLASEILHTLNKLTTLSLRGSYTGRCDLKLPASLQTVLLLQCECSIEWLCSLLITLSLLRHPVQCHLWDVVL
ncbi:hypothetical protein DPMN_176690 [Dreissena polymorpha]|uniref:Uncharacterized protein n=1 Tax=Dreissena polymorpha TaxID=45954 RepID=A0A9D4EAD4_DREPO|nr:hypothetical protein DPMN_176690 [Dreissena polymorpha]